MAILVTGGAGYIASHTLVELIENGSEVVVVDNLSNSSQKSLQRVEEITKSKIKFYNIDVLDKLALRKVFLENNILSVVHFAGLKAVGESVEKPLMYFSNNFSGTLSLVEVMSEFECWNLVFSSSATVYGDPEKVPILESFPTSATNPYGNSKLMVEEMLKALSASNNSWNIAILRYFNPIGAHSSGLIGEDPNGIPNNLMPYISQVAIGILDSLSVFGDDYGTKDGTGVRDYIHVVDLAKGHLKALNKLYQNPGLVIYNLGTGCGYSVLEMINAFQMASGKTIPYEVVGRRAGDIAECWTDPSKAKNELNWQSKLDLVTMMKDTWNWQSKNPVGYQ